MQAGEGAQLEFNAIHAISGLGHNQGGGIAAKDREKRGLTVVPNEGARPWSDLADLHDLGTDCASFEPRGECTEENAPRRETNPNALQIFDIGKRVARNFRAHSQAAAGFVDPSYRVGVGKRISLARIEARGGFDTVVAEPLAQTALHP